ncbi:MAG: bifunctional DNA-formamidopyrimidine glycosylase/DNA-(apurinic or apyrimidinic site) lyase [Pseudomonadales bacterium]|nr:bifunctional DNA-formamidopyrimidine glycosylase/DNA-(apurinic or apyrimidinic site) lyase [Pseudomonadales bacterium]
MPELPEVETTRRGIEPHLLGQRIVGVLVRQPSLRWPVPDDLGQRATGQVIEQVARRAKYLLIQLPTGSVMIHLGMSGSLRIVPGEAPLKIHDHLDILLSSGQVLRYHDPRRFGSVLWVEDPLSHELIASLGPEPLESGFSGQHLYERSRGKKTAVKNFLMDSHIVVGVGNIYANESLFLAGIRPDKAAGKVSLAKYELLAAQVRQVLNRAISAGGTTLRDFLREDGSPGYFKQSLHVYGRGGEPCTNCQRDLKEIRLGQRTTVFCTRCQR